ncbi:uncharacterized protein LOC107470545 [Arachis duranensis]|uniref:Uncharacterized protein LOC107470545 n=1 Tax=Arachis duranensis TaxID=130453 RepID=A0A6P4C9Q5_ARADU|nr:uncharacterized protein LOC107470545 [Arachis duranensis]
MACSCCTEDIKVFWLKNWGKYSWFDCHKRFLDMDHHFQFNKDSFKEIKTKREKAYVRLSGRQILHRVSRIPKIVDNGASLCKSSWVVVVKTKLRGCIESDDKIDGQEPYQIDDPTPSKMVVDTDEPITLRSTVINDGIIDRGIDADTFLPEDDDLQEEDEVDGDKEEEDEFDDHETILEGEDGESEEEDDESE